MLLSSTSSSSSSPQTSSYLVLNIINNKCMVIILIVLVAYCFGGFSMFLYLNSTTGENGGSDYINNLLNNKVVVKNKNPLAQTTTTTTTEEGKEDNDDSSSKSKSKIIDGRIQQQHNQQQHQNENEKKIVYFVPQIGKSGSSTLRSLFHSRNVYYGNPSMTDPKVAYELNQNGCKKSFTGNPNKIYSYKLMNGTIVEVPPPPPYPFIQHIRKYNQDPSFWRITSFNDNDDNDIIDCTNSLLKTAYKFWNNNPSSSSSSTSLIPSSDNNTNYPKPIIQGTVSSSCLKTTMATTNNKYYDDDNDNKILYTCRKLVQIRHPISWIISHYNYFCVNCKDQNKYCGKPVEAKCRPKHFKDGTHETLITWAMKYGNVFTRLLSPNTTLKEGGFITIDGWNIPNPLLSWENIVDETLKRIQIDEDCIVALEDSYRLTKIENCLNDQHGLFEKLGFSSKYTVNPHDKKSLSQHDNNSKDDGGPPGSNINENDNTSGSNEDGHRIARRKLSSSNIQQQQRDNNGGNNTSSTTTTTSLISESELRQLEEILAADIALYNALFPNISVV